MKRALFIAFVAFVWVSTLKGQAIGPPSSETYPFQVGTIMDGGTLYILEKRTKTEAERRYCIDNQINSKTAGELYIGNLHPTHEGARQVPAAEARKILSRIETTLEEFHGKEVLERYRMKPIDFEAMTEKEAEKKVDDPKINERFADRVFVHTHGGAWVFGGGDSVLREAVWLATGVGVKVVSVDYRRPPLHPFPAAIEDAVAVWREVMKDQKAAQAAIFGTSAGGNIALATILKLKELGEPLPGAVFAGTPATDFENISDTWHTLVGLDPLGSREAGGLIAGCFDLYAGNADPSNPLLSPVNGELEGFPPTILISGTRDLLLSDTVRMHRALREAGAESGLHVYDGQAHGDYLLNLLREVPECDDAQRELFDFFDKHLE